MKPLLRKDETIHINKHDLGVDNLSIIDIHVLVSALAKFKKNMCGLIKSVE